jgi:hypothetical protein
MLLRQNHRRPLHDAAVTIAKQPKKSLGLIRVSLTSRSVRFGLWQYPLCGILSCDGVVG